MKKQNFIEGSLILIASAAAAKVMGAIFRIPLANMLGGTGMGYFSSAYGIFMTVYALSVTGLPVAAAKLTAEYTALGQNENSAAVKKTALKMFSLTGLAFTVLMLLFAYPLSLYVISSPQAVFSAAAIAPSIFFSCVTSVFRGCFEGKRNMYPTAVSQVIEAAGKLCAGLLLCRLVLENKEMLPPLAETMRKLFPFEGITSMSDQEFLLPLASAAAVLGVTLSTLAGTVFVAVRSLAEKQPPFSPAAKTDPSIPSKLFATVLPVAAGSLITNLTSLIDLATIIRLLNRAVSRFPRYFQGFLSEELTEAALPNFFFGSFTGLAVTVFNLIPSFTNMFGKSAIPSIAGAFAENNGEKVKRSVMNVIFTTGFIAVPSGIGISVLAPGILELLFPKRAAEAAICVLPLRFLGIGVIFLSVSSVLFSVLQAAGKSDVPVKIMLWGIALKLAANVILVAIPQLNVTGAAISTVLCYGLIFFLALKYTAKYTGISAAEVRKLLSKLIFCGSLCGGGAFLTSEMLSNRLSQPMAVLPAVLVGAVFYIISTHLTGILTKSTLKLLIC